MPESLSTRDVARIFGTDDWRIRRLYEDGDLAEPQRVAGSRVVKRSDLPAINHALAARKWLRGAVNLGRELTAV